ncbi:hypothetical protein KIW84_070836 [Lathyrus oleraceus]|uniref:Uncharacterized protein n=1 Tax=Pisum sativum TaxID=3888 RepID=A0A9D4VIY0_PEA|nr:hypothetical protein KIW84_070836 [Pisum sativum]
MVCTVYGHENADYSRGTLHLENSLLADNPFLSLHHDKQVDMESLLVTGKLTALVVGQDVLNATNMLPFADKTILLLTGACRLTDEGLRLLVLSATELRSINLSQCSLVTCASLEMLDDSLGSNLKELHIDNCILIDVAWILPTLKRFK